MARRLGVPLIALAPAALVLAVILALAGLPALPGLPGLGGLPGLAGLAGPLPARADGDPASDMLLVQNVFYPFQPPVTEATQRVLNAETAAAAKAGVPIKVAIIASPADLGAIPSLFGKPQAYADFLDREISFNGPVPLLVVMAAGYGVQGFKAGVAGAITAVHAPAGRSSQDLAQAAIIGVARLAAAAGHPITRLSASAGAGGTPSNPAVAIMIGLAVVAVLSAGTLIVLRRRRSTPRPARQRG